MPAAVSMFIETKSSFPPKDDGNFPLSNVRLIFSLLGNERSLSGENSGYERARNSEKRNEPKLDRTLRN